MKKTIVFIVFIILASSTSAQMTLKLIKPGYYKGKVDTYYVITSYLSNHPDMFPSKRAEIEIVNKETLGEFTIVNDKGIIMEWDSFNNFFSNNYKNINSPASTIAVKIPNLIIENPDKFHIADEHYAFYKKRIFYHHYEIKEVDFKSFKIIDETYCKDKNNAFYLGKKIVASNALHFKQISQLYSKDDRYVYFKGGILSNANPKTFQKLSYYYQKDDNSVWDNQGYLINVDAKTLKAIYISFRGREEGSPYAIDKDNVYYGANILTSANPKTFKVIVGITSIYGIDENNVYKNGTLIQGADSKTFKTIENDSLEFDAYDKNYKYSRGIRLTNKN